MIDAPDCRKCKTGSLYRSGELGSGIFAPGENITKNNKPIYACNECKSLITQEDLDLMEEQEETITKLAQQAIEKAKSFPLEHGIVHVTLPNNAEIQLHSKDILHHEPETLLREVKNILWEAYEHTNK